MTEPASSIADIRPEARSNFRNLVAHVLLDYFAYYTYYPVITLLFYQSTENVQIILYGSMGQDIACGVVIFLFGAVQDKVHQQTSVRITMCAALLSMSVLLVSSFFPSVAVLDVAAMTSTGLYYGFLQITSATITCDSIDPVNPDRDINKQFVAIIMAPMLATALLMVLFSTMGDAWSEQSMRTIVYVGLSVQLLAQLLLFTLRGLRFPPRDGPEVEAQNSAGVKDEHLNEAASNPLVSASSSANVEHHEANSDKALVVVMNLEDDASNAITDRTIGGVNTVSISPKKAVDSHSEHLGGGGLSAEVPQAGRSLQTSFLVPLIASSCMAKVPSPKVEHLVPPPLAPPLVPASTSNANDEDQSGGGNTCTMNMMKTVLDSRADHEEDKLDNLSTVAASAHPQAPATADQHLLLSGNSSSLVPIDPSSVNQLAPPLPSEMIPQSCLSHYLQTSFLVPFVAASCIALYVLSDCIFFEYFPYFATDTLGLTPMEYFGTVLARQGLSVLIALVFQPISERVPAIYLIAPLQLAAPAAFWYMFIAFTNNGIMSYLVAVVIHVAFREGCLGLLRGVVIAYASPELRLFWDGIGLEGSRYASSCVGLIIGGAVSASQGFRAAQTPCVAAVTTAWLLSAALLFAPKRCIGDATDEEKRAIEAAMHSQGLLNRQRVRMLQTNFKTLLLLQRAKRIFLRCVIRRRQMKELHGSR